MTHISKRSLKASKEGVQLASRAILRFPTKIDFAAELEISRSTVQNFFAGKPVGRENFHKICQELDLSWQQVAELPPQSPKLAIVNREKINHEIAKSNKPTVEADATDSLVSQFRQQVKPRILSMCGTMRVLDMSCPKLVEKIYVNTKTYQKIQGKQRIEVNEMYMASLDQEKRYFELKLPFDETREQISGWEAATRYSKLIVLGKPGSGKTMFLKYLALQCLEGTFKSDRIPVFVPLRDFIAYDSSLSLVNYISNQLTKDYQPVKTHEVKQLLNRGKFLIILDGLDEVRNSDLRSICQHLRRFSEWFPSNSYIISCRHGVQCCNFEQFTEIEIADFRPEQIAEFAAKWLNIDDEDQSLNFLQKLQENNSIQEFATNPLLLTLLCILFEESADFPSSRSEIYEEGLDIMLRQWDAERSIERETGEGLSLQQEKELLCNIARRTFERKQYFFKEAELKFYIANYAINLSNADLSRIDAKKVLKSIEAKHGLLVEQAKKVYSFSHLAFQEYLTAREFVVAYGLPVPTEILQILVSHLFSVRWQEIFLLVAEMSPQADRLFSLMSQQIDLLANQSLDLKAFLEWVDCKAQSIAIAKPEYTPKNQRHDNRNTQTSQLELSKCPQEIIRAFYFSLGFNQILGRIGSNFSLTLKLNPNFGRLISSNRDLALDLSLFNLTNLIPNLESVHHPELTLKRSLERVMTHAREGEPELARELQAIEPIPDSSENTTQFWLWWHQQGSTWSNKINTIAVKYRNIGHQWMFNAQQRQILEQYYQANLLLLDCLERSFYVSPQVKEDICRQLLKLTAIKTNYFQEIELMLQSNIA